MKWYQNKTAIILLLIFFSPAGLWVMWKYSDWNKQTKTVVSAIVAVAVIIIGVFYQSETVPGDNISSAPTASEASSGGEEVLSEAESSSVVEEAPPESETSSGGEEVPSEAETSSVITPTETSIPESTVSSAPPSASTPPETSTPTVEKIKLVSVTSPVGRNETARLEIKGEPNFEYSISVYYGSGASKAAGLEKKMSDAAGSVVWEWKVGGKTAEGKHRIVISGGGEKLETSFTTT
mgnify:CR=1 FL=1|jgi:hypothetical protein